MRVKMNQWLRNRSADSQLLSKVPSILVRWAVYELDQLCTVYARNLSLVKMLGCTMYVWKVLYCISERTFCVLVLRLVLVLLPFPFLSVRSPAVFCVACCLLKTPSPSPSLSLFKWALLAWHPSKGDSGEMGLGCQRLMWRKGSGNEQSWSAGREPGELRVQSPQGRTHFKTPWSETPHQI